MSKFKTFLEQFNNHSVEVVDIKNKNQCFDLAVAWLDWLGLPRTFNHYYAYSIYLNATQGTLKNFERIPNTLEAIPKEGDVVVWNNVYGPAGHVAIATGEGDLNYFKAFSQNDPLGSVSHVRRYDYNNVIGWLRPKDYQYDEQGGELPVDDRRDYWFDLINRVVWKKPHEQITDDMVKDFTKEYPTQLDRSGRWDRTIHSLGFQGDTNKVSVEEVLGKCTVSAQKYKQLEDEIAKWKDDFKKADEKRQKWHDERNEYKKKYETSLKDLSDCQRSNTQLKNNALSELTAKDAWNLFWEKLKVLKI